VKTIDSLQQFKNMVWRARIQCRRTYEEIYIIKYAMKKSLFNIGLVDTPTVCSSQGQKDAIIATSQDSTVIFELELICSKTPTVPSNDESCFGLTRALVGKYPLTGELAESWHPWNGLKTSMPEESYEILMSGNERKQLI